MKKYPSLALLVFLALAALLPLTSSAQKRKTTRRPAAAAPTPTPVADMRPQAQKVADQIKNVSRFVYIYGKIINGLQVADEQAKNGQTNDAVAAQNKKSRDALVSNINGIRTGIEALSREFQANPALQVQYLKVSYAAESAATAEQLARAGRFDDAGKALINVVERLSDALLAMKLSGGGF